MDDLNFSSLSVNECKKHLNIEDDFKDDDDFIKICLKSAKRHIQDYTSLTIEELDKIPSINIALLMLTSDFYDCRSTDKKLSFALKSILDMNRLWL